MENEKKQENLLVTLSGRRRQNAKQQLKSVILECYELFGSELTDGVIQECRDIFAEYCKITDNE